MWADALEKPVQGKTFRVIRVEIMNCDVDYVEGSKGGEQSMEKYLDAP